MFDILSANIAYASFDSFLSNVTKLIINPIIVLLFALASAYFIYGVFQFIVNANNEEKKTEGKNHMLWGIVGLVIMMGVWTLLNLMLNTFNIDGINPQQGTVKLNDYSPSTPSMDQ